MLGGGLAGGVATLLGVVVLFGSSSIIPPPRGLVGAVTSGFNSFLGSRRFCQLASWAPWSMTQNVKAPSKRSTPAHAHEQTRCEKRRDLLSTGAPPLALTDTPLKPSVSSRLLFEGTAQEQRCVSGRWAV